MYSLFFIHLEFCQKSIGKKAQLALKMHIVEQICVKMRANCGFCGKSTKFGTYECFYIGLLNNIRHMAKLIFSPGCPKIEKSKMADTESEKIQS